MGGGPEGAACKSITAASLYHSLFSECNTIWSFLKWIRARFFLFFSSSPRLELASAADFVRLAKWHILRVRCRCFKADTIAVRYGSTQQL